MQLAAAPSPTPTPTASTPTASAAQTATGGAQGGSSFVPTQAPQSPDGAENAREQSSDSAMKQAMRKLKLDSGEEFELDESEYEDYAKRGYRFDQTLKRAEEIRAQNERLVRTLKENPLEILNNPNLGIDTKELARKILMDEIEQEMLSPEERRAQELERELEGYKSREQKAREAREKAAQEARDREVQETYHKMISDSLDKSGLPNNMFTYESMINYMSQAMRAGIHDVQPEHVIKYVERDYRQSMGKLFDGDLDSIMKFFGEENINKLQKMFIQRKKGESIPASQPAERTENVAPRRGLSLQEWQMDVRRQMGL